MASPLASARLSPDPRFHDGTRSSLLVRIRDWADERSWREFHQRYHRLILAMALQSGLSREEAEDVIQETLLSIAKKMPGFVYDRTEGSFENWIRSVTRHRILDQFRKRQPAEVDLEIPPTRTDTADEALHRPPATPVPATLDDGGWDAAWDDAWRATLLETALERLRFRSRPEHFQIFHYSFVRGMGARSVGRTLGVGLPQVYVVRHRLMRELKEEVARLMSESGEGERIL